MEEDLVTLKNEISEIKSLKEQITENPASEGINKSKIKDLEAEAKIGFDETEIHENSNGTTTKYWVSTQNEVSTKTSIGLVGIKVSRPTFYVRWNERVSVNCLLNGKRIARNKLIQKLQGDI